MSHFRLASDVTVDPLLQLTIRTLNDVCREPHIYLIAECDTEDLVDVLRELCEEIFELDGWYRVPSSWPQDRSYEVFCQWFEYQHITPCCLISATNL